MMRCAIVIAVILPLAGATPVAAECRPCTLTATIARAELFTAPDLVELRGELMRIGLVRGRRGWAIETLSIDLLDTSGEGRGAFLGNVTLRGTFLTNRFSIERVTWGAWLGIHLGAMWNDGVRYLLPEAGLRLGAGEASYIALEARPYAAFAHAIDHAATRSLVADLDVDAHASIPLVDDSLRAEARVRYRDITTESRHLRDHFAVVGIAFGPERTARHSFGRTFIGAGVRRVLVDAPLDGSVARTVEGTPAAASWQLLVWLDVDVRFADHRPN